MVIVALTTAIFAVVEDSEHGDHRKVAMLRSKHRKGIAMASPGVAEGPVKVEMEARQA